MKTQQNQFSVRGISSDIMLGEKAQVPDGSIQTITSSPSQPVGLVLEFFLLRLPVNSEL